MKKFIPFLMLTLGALAASAQDIIHLPGGQSIDREFTAMLGTLAGMYIVVSFILAVTRSIQEYRLKSKLIEKGVSDKVVEQFLQPGPKDTRSQIIKWFMILVGLGVGLTIISMTLPLGIHSMAIMSFSIALSFLGYYFFTRKSKD
jgi:hypothetical protein